MEKTMSTTMLKEPVKMAEVFNKTHHTTTIDARIMSSDGTFGKDFSLETSAMAYNYGEKSVTIESVEYDEEIGASHNWTTHKILYPVIATASNGEIGKKTFELNASGHYNQGYRDGLAKTREIVKVTKLSDSDGMLHIRIWFNEKDFTDCAVSE